MVVALMLVAGCGSSNRAAEAAEDDGLIAVVATIGQVTNIAEIVGGEHVRVNGLMGAGVDPHLYVASEGDVELLQNAEIIFYSGLFLEAQMTDVLEQLGERKTVTAVAGNADPSLLLPWAQYADEYDPHVWFDVTLWMKSVEAVRDTLVVFDPEHAADYEANTTAYLAELERWIAGVDQPEAVTEYDWRRFQIEYRDDEQYFRRDRTALLALARYAF